MNLRNQPCPCGSGRKSKKCCLRIVHTKKPVEPLQIAVDPALPQRDQSIIGVCDAQHRVLRRYVSVQFNGSDFFRMTGSFR